MIRRPLAVLALLVAVSAAALPVRGAAAQERAAPTGLSAESLRGGAEVPVHVSTFGYEGVGGLQGVLSLGLLMSEYAVELNGATVFDWRIKSAEATVRARPGPARLRVMIRTTLGRTPQVLYDKPVAIASGPDNKIGINFLTTIVSVNGQDDEFQRKDR